MSAGVPRSLLDFIQTPVMVGDPDGRVVYVNPAFETDFLVPLEEVSGQPVANLFEGGGREAVLHAVARVCGSQSAVDAERFSLIVEDRGYKAIASAVEAEGGHVGVILLLVRESASEARMQSFRREIQAPLDELSACLSAVAEYATGPDAQAQRIAIADGVRCLERVRKWAERRRRESRRAAVGGTLSLLGAREAQPLEPDEAARVALVVAARLLERRLSHRIERHRRAAAGDLQRALVEPHARLAGHVSLRRVDRGAQEVHLGREPEAVVDQLGEARGEAVALVHHLAVERDRLDRAVRGVEHGAARRLVDAARLHPDEAVLDHVDAADAVRARDLVQAVEQVRRARAARRRSRPACPSSKPTRSSRGGVGRISGDFVRRNMLSSGSRHGSSRIPPS